MTKQTTKKPVKETIEKTEKVLPKIAVSVGDLNGIGIEIAIKSHEEISKICTPIYCINKTLLDKCASLLNLEVPENFTLFETAGDFEIKPSKISKNAGLYSYVSFIDAINLAIRKEVDGICTLPINKQSWAKANISYRGHTQFLRDVFKQDAIMMLGCEKMYVALYTEHIPLKDVARNIKYKHLKNFFLDFNSCIETEKIGVLGLNPHAGDDGVLGKEEKEIKKAIKKANKILKKEIFVGPLVPDIAFSPKTSENFKYYVAMYHDQGLAPLKALYFDESVNVSLNLPIVRTSVDHGTAFDIAYKDQNPSNHSYVNAIKEAVRLSLKR